MSTKDSREKRENLHVVRKRRTEVFSIVGGPFSDLFIGVHNGKLSVKNEK
jgi:hypothetical protein